MSVVIRAAGPGDHPAIAACVTAAYGRYIDRIGKKPAPMLDDYRQLIADGVVHVAELDEELVGLIVMWAEADHFYVDNVAVHPANQATGVGAALLRHADVVAEAAGRSEIRLYTHETMTENIDYYPRRGFVETHRATDKGYERVYFTRRL